MFLPLLWALGQAWSSLGWFSVVYVKLGCAWLWIEPNLNHRAYSSGPLLLKLTYDYLIHAMATRLNKQVNLSADMDIPHHEAYYKHKIK